MFTCDYKAIQTASRADMCIYLLKKGTVINKLSGREMSNMKDELLQVSVQERPVATPQISITDSINAADSLLIGK
ncbi:MAG: hypothetical protein IPH18_01550 [Chitinophagaceae bacterium]|nr:hypothetical protein [Chitinophagaceae bacterium]